MTNRCTASTVKRRSPSRWNFQIEQWAILLAAEDVAVPGTAAGSRATDGELDGQCGIELDAVGDAIGRDAEDAADGVARQGAAAAHAVIVCRIGEDHIEGDAIHTSVLAADGLGQ